MRTIAFSRVLGVTLLASAARLLLPAVLAGVIALTPAPAASQAVTVPPGSSTMGSTIPVQWNPSFTSSPTVFIRLAGYGGNPVVLAASVPNNGQASVNLPRPPVVPCEPNRLYYVHVSPGLASGTVMVSSAAFKLICWGGSLTVVKTVINESGRAVPVSTFSVGVSCGPGGPNATLSLSQASSYRDSLLYIPPGRTCSISEAPPKAPAGCRWQTTYPQGKGIDISESPRRLDVHNRLTCQDGGNTGPRSLPAVTAPTRRPPTP